MSEVLERFAREVAFEEAQETAKRLFENGADFEIVRKSINLTEEVLRKIYDEVQSTK